MFRLLIVFICMVSVGPAFSQATRKVDADNAYPNLTGTWKLEAKRQRDKAATDWQTRLVIDHTGHEIKVVRKTTNGKKETEHDLISYSDGRGEQNDGVTIPNVRITEGQIQSESRWQGKKLRTYATIRKPLYGPLLTWKLIAEWKLSSDAQMLTHTIRIVPENSDIIQMSGGRRPPSLPTIIVTARPAEFKYVFRRSP